MENSTSGYSSHLPVLDCIMEIIKPETALEFGCGLFSTPYLLSKCKKVTSVDLSLDWLNKVKQTVDPVLHTKWNSISTDSEILFFRQPGLCQYGVILVDGGDYKMRREVAQACVSLRLSQVVVMHDTERIEYKWDTMMVPDGWTFTRIQGKQPWTTVASPDNKLNNTLVSKWACTVCVNTSDLRSIGYPAICSSKP